MSRPTKNTAEAQIRRARPQEAAALSELALRSKAVWGYSQSFMAACRQELSLDAQFIENHPVFVIETDGSIAGFYALEHISSTQVELGFLFVAPAYIGRGLGKSLMMHAKEQARLLGYQMMVIQGDPNAQRFYFAAGAHLVGEKKSGSMSGRSLPLFQLDLTPSP